MAYLFLNGRNIGRYRFDKNEDILADKSYNVQKLNKSCSSWSIINLEK